jgi:hypothetical protein
MSMLNEGTDPQRRPAAIAVISKVTWQRAGRITEPGRYMFRFGWLTVTTDDLAVWQQYPQAAFTLVRMTADMDADEFHLGAFELPVDPSPET